MTAQGNALGTGARSRVSPERAPQEDICSALSGLPILAICLPRALPWAHMALPLWGDALADAQPEADFTFRSQHCPVGRRIRVDHRCAISCANAGRDACGTVVGATLSRGCPILRAAKGGGHSARVPHPSRSEGWGTYSTSTLYQLVSLLTLRLAQTR